MNRISLLGASVALALALTACADTDEKASKNGGPDVATTALSNETDQLARAQVLVSGASKNVAQAERVFPGLGGMVGVVIGSPDGEGLKGIVWMSPDGSAIFPGAPTDEKGENLSERAALEQKINDGNATPSAPPAAGAETEATLRTLLEESAKPQYKSILQGTAGPVVTVFMDLNCSHCQTFFVNAQPQIEAGKMRVRYVLAGFLTPTSAPKAAAVLGASDPLAALIKSEADFAKNGPAGKAPNATKASLATVDANTKLLATSGNISTPFVMFCAPDQSVQGASGSPTDMAVFLRGVSDKGHPACAK